MKYRKKSDPVNAIQWNGFGVYPVIPEIHELDPYNEQGKQGMGWIPTLEGGYKVTPSDWIVTGIHGEKCPVKDDIFKETYEREDGTPI